VEKGSDVPSLENISLALVCLCATALGSAPAGHTQGWPAKPVKIVVAFSPGGSADQLGRLIAPELLSAFKQQFYIENKPGNSGSIGSALVARAEPDGYTLVVAGSGPHLTGPAINPNIGYDPLKDFTHVAMIAADSFVVVVNPALGVRSLDELVRLARVKPLTSSSPGAGSLGHLILEQFKRKAGIDITHVPAPNAGMTEVLGNHISMSFTTLLTAGEQIRSDKFVALAVTSSQRNPAYKEIRTFGEQGYPDVRGDTWFWLAGPKNLPPNVVGKLNAELRRIVKLPKTQAYFEQMALLSMDADSAAVTKFVADEYAFWAPLAKDSGLRVQ
jgi:tripartite-type tricarboxylate transporter receptor subunit TctC